MVRTTRTITAPTVRPESTREISVIIPAAGFGSRMKSYGPKPLVKVKDDLSIIDNQLKYINKYVTKAQIILVGGFEINKVRTELKRKNIQIVENKDWEDTNVVASIGIGLKHAKNESVLVVYGDLVFNAWTLKAPFGPYSLVITDKGGYMKDEEVGCVVQDNLLQQMMYGLPNKWAQIAYFTGREKDMLEEICWEEQHKKYFGFEAINMIVENGGRFASFANPRMKATDIDSSKDLSTVEFIL